MRSQYLCSVVPIGFVPVVFAGVVACRNVYSALRFEVSYGERALRCGAQIVEKINLYAVCREDISHSFGKQARVVATVVAHYYRDLLLVFKVHFKVIGKPLCSHSNGVDVHSVGACAHDAAQATRSELEVFIERLYKRVFVVAVQHVLDSLSCCFVESRSKPLSCFLFTLVNKFFVLHSYLIVLLRAVLASLMQCYNIVDTACALLP